MRRAEVVKWKGALDEEVEGVLYYPHDYKEGEKYPLILMIHGGPFGVSLDAWDESWDMRAEPVQPARRVRACGRITTAAAITAWPGRSRSAAGKYYDLPLADIERGVDALVARGLADPDRLGVLGWSNGAILTSALIARTTRFKAAAAGAGGAEWVADWATCEFGDEFDRYYFGKSPLEDPQLYVKLAPLYQFDKVRTPTLSCSRATPTGRCRSTTAGRSTAPCNSWARRRCVWCCSPARSTAWKSSPTSAASWRRSWPGSTSIYSARPRTRTRRSRPTRRWRGR